jgi:TM2 domain-containing membrane protein YozV
MENFESNQHLPPVNQPPVDNKKMAAGLLGIFLGALGIHKFILGYNAEGGIMLGVTIGSLIIGFATMCIFIGFIIIFIPALVHIIGLIEGIIYLTKSDTEFYETYQKNKKAWF